MDAALKAADVKMCVLYAPPSETNFGGALLTGSQSACKAACDAFAAAVEFVADNQSIRLSSRGATAAGKTRGTNICRHWE